MLAVAHQSGDTTGGGGGGGGRVGGILMAAATAAFGGAFATTNQIDSARNLILSETRSGDPFSVHGNISAADTNQTTRELASFGGDVLFNSGNHNNNNNNNNNNNSELLAIDNKHATAFPLLFPSSSSSLSQPQSVLATFSGWDLLLISVLISIILISIIGNCLVCVAIFTDRRLRKLGNAFIVSLAIADLFVSCLVMTFALCNDLMNYWMFGEWFCDIWISFDIMCCTASILNLCAISLDRFIHIKDCLLYNQLMTKRVAISAVIIIWIISALVSFVPINLGWHKPNHFKQPTTNLALYLNNLNNTIQASSTPPRMPPTDLDYHYDDAAAATTTTTTAEDDNKLALVSRESHSQSQVDRHKRQANTEHSIIGTSPTISCYGKWCDTTTTAGMELNDKISEIRPVEVVPNWAARADYRGSQISNKLLQSRPNSQHRIRSNLRQRFNMQPLLSSSSNMQATGNAPIGNNDDHSGGPKEARSPDGRRGEHLQGNESRSASTWEHGSSLVSVVAGGAPSALEQANLVAAQVPGGSLGDGANNLSQRRPPIESDDVENDDDDDGGGGDDESKQRRQATTTTTASQTLHKNELFDQVAPPESNPELRQNRRQQHAGSLLEQIKHLPPSDQMLNRYQIGEPQLGASPMTVASLEAHTDRLPSDSAATSSRTKRSPQELNGNHREQTNRPRTTTATTGANNSPNKVDAAIVRATLSTTYRPGSSQDDHDGDNERQPTATVSQRQATHANPSSHPRMAARQQRATGDTTPKVPTTSELPQCMLTLTPTYAVISSTISFYIPCIIMLGLYSKLFACARRHVRNIKAISKAPQPIGFGSPAGGRTAGQATNAISILNDCGGNQSRSVTSNEIVNGRQSNATSASSRRDPNSLSIGPIQTTGGNNGGGSGSCSGSSAGNSIGMQCRARLARFVRRPELKLATKSRTWIKIGSRSSAAKLKPNQAGTAVAELVLSASSDVPAETEALTAADAAATANQKVAQSGCGPVLNKLNSNISKQNAQTTTIKETTTTTSYSAADYDGDGNDHDKTNAHGNETEPFLNEPNSQQQQETATVVTLNSVRLQVQPADDDTTGQINEPMANAADLPNAEKSSPNAKRARHKTLAVANSAPATNSELNPSRTEANVGLGANQRPKIITTTYTTSGDIAPAKLSADNNHHRHHNQTNSWHQQQRQQQQQQHHYQQQQQAQSNKQQTSQLATHKAAITLGIIMGTFLFCWVPFFCLNIIKAYHGDSIPSSLFRAFTWLGYANSALNPIIYGIHNSEFRNAFNRIFFKHLTLKNGRQYLNRRFSYDLRQHHPNQQQHNRQQHQSRRNHDSQGDQHGERHRLASAQQQSQFQHQNQRLISSPSPTPTTTCEKDMTYSQTQPAGCDETTIQQDLNMSKQQQQQQHHCEVQQ